MSQEKAGIRNEAVRRFLATFEDEDDAFRAALYPEIEWYPIEETGRPRVASMRPWGTGISG